MRSELLEPDAVKVARPVLRGGGGSDAASLPDRALAIWEVDAFGRLDSFAHGTLWHQVESFLFSRFPLASRIYTDDSEPGEDSVQNRDFLAGLGYQPVVGRVHILAKEVRPQ